MNPSAPAARRLLVLCPYPVGVAAGQRFKYEQYFSDWQRAGWTIEVASFFDRATWDVLWVRGKGVRRVLGTLQGLVRRLWTLRRVRQFDCIYVFMWITPFGSSLAERLCRKRAPRLIYDIEDNIVSSTPIGMGALTRVMFEMRRAKAVFLARNADEVIVASPLIVEETANVARGRVHLIPPSLDVDRIRPTAEIAERPRPVVGWTGTFSSRPYLDLVASPLRELAKRADFEFRVIGNFEYDVPGVRTRVVRWSAEREAADLQELDIGIYPLPEDEWTNGKAGLKIIQYQSAGLPCVASDAPLSREQIRQGETGYLVRSHQEWVERLGELLADASLRRRMGAAGRCDAVARYGRDVVSAKYLDVLAGIPSADLARTDRAQRGKRPHCAEALHSKGVAG